MKLRSTIWIPREILKHFHFCTIILIYAKSFDILAYSNYLWCVFQCLTFLFSYDYGRSKYMRLWLLQSSILRWRHLSAWSCTRESPIANIPRHLVLRSLWHVQGYQDEQFRRGLRHYIRSFDEILSIWNLITALFIRLTICDRSSMSLVYRSSPLF